MLRCVLRPKLLIAAIEFGRCEPGWAPRDQPAMIFATTWQTAVLSPDS
jgi:hypothetical protein